MTVRISNHAFLLGQIEETKRMLHFLANRHKQQEYDLLITESRIKENVKLLKQYELLRQGYENERIRNESNY